MIRNNNNNNLIKKCNFTLKNLKEINKKIMKYIKNIKIYLI